MSDSPLPASDGASSRQGPLPLAARRQAVFYPNAGHDGHPIKWFAPTLPVAILVDWDVSAAAARAQSALKGYDQVSVRDLPVDALFPPTPPSTIRRDAVRHGGIGPLPPDPFATKYIWQFRYVRRPEVGPAHGLPALEVYYIGGESTVVYEALFTRHGIGPAALAMVQPGGGCGSAVWTDLAAPEGPFHQLVRAAGLAHMPARLLYGGQGSPGSYARFPWSEYRGAATRQAHWQGRGFCRTMVEFPRVAIDPAPRP